MADQQAYETEGAPDIELGTPRTRPVRYTVALPDGYTEGDRLAGLVLFIPGFGEDNDEGYINSFCGWVADTFGLACVTAGYHAFGTRPSNGASRQFTQPDADRLAAFCMRCGVPVKDGDHPGELLVQLHEAYKSHVAAGRASGMLTMTCGLVALGGEQQNFGLMQALDHLHVLHDLRGRLDYDRRNILAVGSSHGGYLAQLIAKLAPNTLRAVFDNSGYAAPPLRYINGREMNLPDYIEQYSDAMQMHYFNATMWSFNEQAPNHYHGDARALRSLMEPSHLRVMADAGGKRTRYRCVHGPDDPIAPTQEKADCCGRLAEAGFDVHYKCMGPGDVDGRYVKSLDHGMGLSLRGFFERSYATLPETDLAAESSGGVGDEFDRGTQLEYPGPKRVYRFAFGPDGIEASLTPTGG